MSCVCSRTSATPIAAKPSRFALRNGYGWKARTSRGVVRTAAASRAPVAITATTAPGSVHTYTRWSQITQETIDGRVWEGVHYRFSDETAARLGKQVAAWDLPRLRRLGL